MKGLLTAPTDGAIARKKRSRLERFVWGLTDRPAGQILALGYPTRMIAVGISSHSCAAWRKGQIGAFGAVPGGWRKGNLPESLEAGHPTASRDGQIQLLIR